jgi:nucleoside-diphosphate-sugar epimerase
MPFMTWSRTLPEILSRLGKYFFISTAAVYGTGEAAEISENVLPAPISWHEYGRNKLLAEQELGRFPHLSWIIVRPCVVYGPGDSHEPRASYFFQRIFHQVPLLIPGSSEVRNNDIYVADLAALLMSCLNISEKTVLNAAGIPFTWPEYLQTLAEVLRKPLPPCRFLGMSLLEFRQWKYCKKLQFYHNAFYEFVLKTDAAQALGWLPQYSLKLGLTATWEWLWENRRALFDQPQDRFEWEKKLFAGE